jgi:hypothetical protein
MKQIVLISLNANFDVNETLLLTLADNYDNL